MSLLVSSQAFTSNGPIPPKYTPDGDEVSPPLGWSKVPDGTRSIGVLVDDPDAPRGTYTHWIVTGITPATEAIAEGQLPRGAHAGVNDGGDAGWMGPSPPSGCHRYVFHVYALDVNLDDASLDRAGFVRAIAGHVLDHGELIGTYQRPSAAI